MKPPAALGRLERALHRFAFATRRAQLGIADLEELLFRRELRATLPGPPVFVTALPRGGTTMLLEVLAGCPEFAAHRYRDMPFVLCPLLWRAFARRFRAPSSAPRERAHGDGILISTDSPESFEELLWSWFWPEQYGARTIRPWPDAARPEFAEFFAQHRRKIVALQARDVPAARRYLSKNNLNIARLPALFAAVPDATVVVPFREPAQQAASLLRQHLRFCAMHRDSAFARRYMAAIGHFEFGANLRPVDFDGWFGARTADDATRLPFWLDYWLASYRHLLRYAADRRVVFVDFVRLATTHDVAALAARLGITTDVLRRESARLRPPPRHDAGLADVAPATRNALLETFAALEQCALR